MANPATAAQQRQSLLAAIEAGDIATVRGLLQSHPQLATLPDSPHTAYLPIHAALNVPNVSTELIELLVAAAPDSTTAKGRYTAVPLSLAISRNQPPEVIDLLLRANPQAAAIGDERGDCALHSISYYRRSQDRLRLFNLMLAACPDAARIKGQHGLPVVSAVAYGRVAITRALLKVAPETPIPPLLQHLLASPPRNAYQLFTLLFEAAPTAAQDTELQLLHLACSSYRQLRPEIILDLLRANPRAASVPSTRKNSSGDLPLHLCLRCDQHPKASLAVLQAFPDAAKIPDRSDQYPIAVARDAEVAAKIIELAPETVTKPHPRTGLLPLQAAVSSSGISASTIRVLMKAAPDVCMAADKDGNLPLHLAISSRNLGAAQVLLEHGPHSASHRNKVGNNPLHCLVRQASTLDQASLLSFGRALIQVGGASLCSEYNSDGNTPIHQAAKNIDLLQLLLQFAPDAAMLKNKASGNTPLHLAAAAGNSTCVSALLNVQAAALTTTNSDGLLPLDLAITSRRKLSFLIALLPPGLTFEAAVAESQQRRLHVKKEVKPLSTPFQKAEQGRGSYPRTRLEMQLILLSRMIREKRRWWEKMDDTKTVDKWRNELLKMMEKRNWDVADKNEAKLDYVIQELDIYRRLRDPTTGIEMSTVDGVYQSDALISEELRQELVSLVEALQHGQRHLDWHPGSNEQVLDLVHPSLFPLVFGVTRAVDESQAATCIDDWQKMVGGGELVQPGGKFKFLREANDRRHGNQEQSWSRLSQWLPTEVAVSADGSRVQFLSYINNLHPGQHRALYAVLEQILAKFVPLFQKTLGYLENPPGRRVTTNNDWWRDPPPESVALVEEQPATETGAAAQKGEEEEEEVDYEKKNREAEERRARRIFVHPSVPTEPQFPPVDVEYDLHGRRLQVIVKLADIILTPEKPEYPGGVWHVEGMENESIVASAIYYYESRNITESRLRFREKVAELDGCDYNQCDYDGVCRTYAVEQEGPGNQELGSIITQKHRALCFPNLYQHQVAPFELEDASMPGVRKILVFFLVDPAVRIRSTAVVPPQQKSWYGDVLAAVPPFSQLPRELVNAVVDQLDWPMSRQQAEQHRLRLMEERKYFITENNQEWFERPYSLCEH